MISGTIIDIDGRLEWVKSEIKKIKKKKHSVILYMIEKVRVFNPFDELFSVLYVRPEVANLRMEDVWKTLLAHKKVR